MYIVVTTGAALEFAGLSCPEIVAIALATSVLELFAFLGAGVVKPSVYSRFARPLLGWLAAH